MASSVFEAPSRHLTCPYYPYYCSCVVRTADGRRSEFHCPVRNCPSCYNRDHPGEELDIPMEEEEEEEVEERCFCSHFGEEERAGVEEVEERCFCKLWGEEERAGEETEEIVSGLVLEDEDSAKNPEMRLRGNFDPRTSLLEKTVSEGSGVDLLGRGGRAEEDWTATGVDAAPACPCSARRPPACCPIGYPACSLFPKGRCPTEDLGLCDCGFPVPPCLARPLCGRATPARTQYCLRKECCMGLPRPPLRPPSGPFWYKVRETRPGREETKIYVDFSPLPPPLPPSADRAHPYWEIVRSGEGFLKCSTVKTLLERRGPSTDRAVQYNPKECEFDPLTKAALRSKKNEQAKMNQILADIARG